MDGFNAINNATLEQRAVRVLPKAPSHRIPMAIILEPSRELAEQTFEQIKLFRSKLPKPTLREALLIGGLPAKEQLKALQQGADVVVGTPGRIDEFVQQTFAFLARAGV